MSRSVISVRSVVINVANYEKEQAFWSQLLGVAIAREFPGFCWLEPQHQGAISVALQQVRDPTPGRNRLHLDTGVEDLGAAHARILEPRTPQRSGLGRGEAARSVRPAYLDAHVVIPDRPDQVAFAVDKPKLDRAIREGDPPDICEVAKAFPLDFVHPEEQLARHQPLVQARGCCGRGCSDRRRALRRRRPASRWLPPPRTNAAASRPEAR